MQARVPVQVNPLRSSTTTVVQSSLPQPTLPPIPSRIQERIAKDEYIDFTSLLSKSMFGASEYQSQSLTLQLNPSGENYSIQPTTTTASRKITSFTTWMEAWNVYLAVRILLNPSCAPYLVEYQCIITTANSRHPLHAWVNYDTKFRTKAANDPSLRWDIRDLYIWLECFPDASDQPNHWPCHHCGSTTHYPSKCSFRSSPSLTGGKQPAPANSQQRANTPRSQRAVTSTDLAVTERTVTTVANSYNCKSGDIHVAKLLSDTKHRKIEPEYNRLENTSKNMYWRINAIEQSNCIQLH